MSDRRRRNAYERLLIDWCDRVCNLLVRAALAALALLLVMQLLLLSPWVREHFTSVERLEGVPYRHAAQTGEGPGTVELSGQRRN